MAADAHAALQLRRSRRAPALNSSFLSRFFFFAPALQLFISAIFHLQERLKASTGTSIKALCFPRATRATNYLGMEICMAQHQGDRLNVTRATSGRGHPEEPHVLPYSLKCKSHPGPAWLFQQRVLQSGNELRAEVLKGPTGVSRAPLHPHELWGPRLETGALATSGMQSPSVGVVPECLGVQLPATSPTALSSRQLKGCS